MSSLRRENPAAIIRVVLRKRRYVRIRQRRRRERKFEIPAPRRHVPDPIAPAFQLVPPYRLANIFVRLRRKRYGRIKLPLEPPREIFAQTVDFPPYRKNRPLIRHPLVYAPKIIVFVCGQALFYFLVSESELYLAPFVHGLSPLDVREEIFRQLSRLPAFDERFRKQRRPIFVHFQEIVFVDGFLFPLEHGELHRVDPRKDGPKRLRSRGLREGKHLYARDRGTGREVGNEFGRRRERRAIPIVLRARTPLVKAREGLYFRDNPFAAAHRADIGRDRTGGLAVFKFPKEVQCLRQRSGYAVRPLRAGKSLFLAEYIQGAFGTVEFLFRGKNEPFGRKKCRANLLARFTGKQFFVKSVHIDTFLPRISFRFSVPYNSTEIYSPRRGTVTQENPIFFKAATTFSLLSRTLDTSCASEAKETRLPPNS